MEQAQPALLGRRESYTCWACASKYQATFRRENEDPIAGAVPCPLCAARGRGNYLKDTADLYSGIPIVLALSCAVLAGLTELDVLGSDWASAMAATVCLVFAAEAARRAAQDPNRNLNVNRCEADRLVAEGILQLQVEGNKNRSDPPVAVATGWKRLLFVLPVLGSLICLLPLLNWLSISMAIVVGPLLAIGSFAGLAYLTSRLHGAESLTGTEIIQDSAR